METKANVLFAKRAPEGHNCPSGFNGGWVSTKDPFHGKKHGSKRDTSMVVNRICSTPERGGGACCRLLSLVQWLPLDVFNPCTKIEMGHGRWGVEIRRLSIIAESKIKHLLLNVLVFVLSLMPSLTLSLMPSLALSLVLSLMLEPGSERR